MRSSGPRHPAISARRARMPVWVRRIDRATSDRINAARSRHVHDRALTRVTRAADHGVLWYAVAAALPVIGQRRAALRGIGSMLVASVISDVIVKGVFDGRRPGFEQVPIVRRLRRYPTTRSFPSGHSASAAAFAAGVAFESARTGLVIAPLAAAVAYSRLHVGAHWLSDVVGGVAIGAAVALLGQLVFPVRPR